MKIASLFLLFTLGASSLLHAQEFDLSNSHLPILSLDGQWRFHTGDDPAWADPKFDDSKWELLRSDQNWAEQGHTGYSGIAWYRFQVDLPPETDKITLYLPYILTSYQVYASGRLIGSYGKMPPHPVPYWGGGWFRSYPFSVAKGANQKIIIAIRVWHWPGWAEDFGGGPSEGGSLVGDTDAIAQRDALSRAAHHWDLASTMILALLQTLAAIGALVLFLLIRSERGYLWFGVMMLIGAIAGWLSLSFAFNEWNILVSFPLQDALPLVGVSLAEAAFYRHLLKGRRTLLFHIGVAGILLILLYLVVQSYAILDPTFQTGLSATTVNLLETLLQLPLDVWILSLLFVRARENILDARLLLVPVVLQKLAQLFQGAAIVTYNLGWQGKFGYDIALVHQPFQIELLQVADALFMMAILVILIYRFTRTRSQWARVQQDLDAARTIQRSLLPTSMPSIPGFSIGARSSACYEVGGDYLDILRLEDGTHLMVVADVAGKGLASAIVATSFRASFRSLASQPLPLAELAARIGQQHWEEGAEAQRRYVTAIFLHLRTQDGVVEIVNAGHNPGALARSAGSVHLFEASGLPLGMFPGMSYTSETFPFPAGSRLLFYTDGLTEVFRGEEEFGSERLIEAFLDSSSSNAPEILESLWQELASFSTNAPQVDDMTALAVCHLGPLQQELTTP